METAKFWEDEGVTIPDPYHRNLKVLFGPDRQGIPEISLNEALIFPNGKTDYHKHDRPELIYIAEGKGTSVCDGVETGIEKDMALWVRAGEMHQIINTGTDTLKLVTIFVPGYEAKATYATCMKAAEEARENGK